jgi:hypothetical protein
MDASDRARLEAYIRSQNYFRNVAEEVAQEMLIGFIRRTLPWLLDRIYDAIAAGWEIVRWQLGW